MNGNGMKVLWVMVISMFMSLGVSAKIGGEKDSADSGVEQETKEESQAALSEPLFVKPTPVPDTAQVEKAAKIAKELCEDDTKALKAGSLKGENFALKLMGYSGKTENAAVKFVFLRNAFRQFLMAGDIKNAQELFDRAFDKFGGRFAAEMANFSVATLRKLANSAKLSKSVKPLLARVEEAMASCEAIAEAEADLKNRSADMRAKLKLALHAVKLQDWELALKTYAELEDKRGALCGWEIVSPESRSKDYSFEQVGDFWWEGIEGKDEQGLLFRSISRHAAYWYRKALAEGGMTELKSALVKKRIAKSLQRQRGIAALTRKLPAEESRTESIDVVDAQTAAKKRKGPQNEYLVVSLETNIQGKFAWWYEAMTTQEECNLRYNTDEYKTKKIVFRRIPAGKYPVQRGNAKAIMDKDYYIGIFELTEGQYSRIIGAGNITSKKPLVGVSWNTIRGGASSAVKISNNGSGVLAKLNSGVQKGTSGWPYIDLPTEAMWEVACRANCPATWEVYWGADHTALDAQGRDSSFYRSASRSDVGKTLPNSWGLYDMLGNVWEYVLDSLPKGQPWDNGYGMAQINFKSMSMTQVPANSGKFRMIRGTNGNDSAFACYMSGRNTDRDANSNTGVWDGFRLAIICK